MSMDTTINVDHTPVDQAEVDRITGWLTELAQRYELSEPDVRVHTAQGGCSGIVQLASYNHKYQIENLDTVARIISRLIPGRDVRVEEEGLHDDYWGECATYRSGRMIRTGRKQWVEHDTIDA